MKRFILLFVLLISMTMTVSSAETLDWKYDSSSDTYYVVGIVYCDNPADQSYEQMGIYVPSAYLTKNSNGSYGINSSGTCNGFTAATAPIFIMVKWL